MATVEGGSGQAQRPARRRHADLRGQRRGGHQQFFPSLRFNPSSPATFPLYVDDRVRGGQFLLQPRHLRFELADLAAQGIGFGRLGAAFFRCQGLERTVAARLAPDGQMRAVQALATQQTADLAGLGATVGFLEDTQPVFSAEPPPGRLGHNLRIGRPGRYGAAGPGGLVATLLDPPGPSRKSHSMSSSLSLRSSVFTSTALQ